MEHSRFVHPHCHTEYSLLDGANKVDKLLERIKALKQPAVAMTDHGNMFGGDAALCPSSTGTSSQSGRTNSSDCY
jgi:DNA polymerase III alpha subunit